ncbi:DUF4179 domain-containing protein [Paenibacillus sp. PDC88]|uniref:DUF4179 domain-containing protein n=1 Tax=Paenibacillus sp. PDC88 TaxID=1884375 RepID=UPI00089B0E7A|nr:DUF4179 domain-containing protein [Paenibacillus sp. PDC88]SDW06924.1 protein of unknown function [Paenibacillus sp. PDC88]
MHFITEEWEQAVLKDKAKVDSYLKDLPLSAMDESINLGMVSGKHRIRRQHKKRIGIICTAAAASLLILFTASIRISPVFAAVVSELPLMNKFVEVVRYNSVYSEAIESNLYQEMDITMQVGDTTLTIGGILADEDRLTVLYSFEGADAEKMHSRKFLWFQLLDSKGRIIGGIDNYSGSSIRDDEQGELYSRADFILHEGQSMPKSVLLEASYYKDKEEQVIEIPVEIDQSRFAQMKEIVPIHQTIKVHGQRIRIEELVITPLQSKLKVIADPNNTKQINDFMKLTLTDNTGNRLITNSSYGDMNEEGGRTYFFESLYFDQPSKINLEAKGVYLNNKNEIFQFNTKTIETISTPDPRIILEQVETTDEGMRISILMKEMSKSKDMSSYPMLQISDHVTDAVGDSYPLELSRTELVSEHVTQTWRYKYLLPAGDYKQPLRLEMHRYPGSVEEKITIPIK